MPEHQRTFFLYCESCDYQQDVAMILPHTPFKSVDELVREAHRFHCSVCGAKKIVVRESEAIGDGNGKRAV